MLPHLTITFRLGTKRQDGSFKQVKFKPALADVWIGQRNDP